MSERWRTEVGILLGRVEDDHGRLRLSCSHSRFSRERRRVAPKTGWDLGRR